MTTTARTDYTIGVFFRDLILSVIAVVVAAKMTLAQSGTATYAIALCLTMITLAFLGLYDIRRFRTAACEVGLAAFGLTAAALQVAGIHAMIPALGVLPAEFFALYLVLSLSLVIGVRLSYRSALLKKASSRARVLILGAGKRGVEAAQALRHPEAHREVVGFLDDSAAGDVSGIPILGGFDAIQRRVLEEDVDEVVVAVSQDDYPLLSESLAGLRHTPIQLTVVPDYSCFAPSSYSVATMGSISTVSLHEPVIDGWQRFAKRLFDVTVAAAVLSLTWPLFAFLGALIRFDSKGPVFFKQLRVGENGKLFWMYKFRTMSNDAEKRQAEVVRYTESGQVVHKVRNDPRVTRLGQFLRRSSLDELPNLINVFKGEMTIVGPRPELPWLVERYEPWQRERLVVPQGIASWWAINGRSDRPLHLNTEDDVYYVRHYSFLFDLWICWKTIGVVLRGKGAY